MASIDHITTADQLFSASHLGRSELVLGELIMMSPAGFEHGRVVTAITRPLANFVYEHSLGVVTGAETGFRIASDPDTVRAPDVGFVVRARLPEVKTTGYFPGPPDLAVEVLSPNDRPQDVAAKVQQWLDTGTQVVWLTDPAAQTVTIHRNNTAPQLLANRETVTAEEVLPGFSLAVGEIFAELSAD
jgi:Uma2 family endonuclease